jgi:hypothetical protein
MRISVFDWWKYDFFEANRISTSDGDQLPHSSACGITPNQAPPYNASHIRGRQPTSLFPCPSHPCLTSRLIEVNWDYRQSQPPLRAAPRATGSEGWYARASEIWHHRFPAGPVRRRGGSAFVISKAYVYQEKQPSLNRAMEA